MKEASADWFENAVLVYGPRKAGTTLLHNLLDGGGELFVYPEELKLKRLVVAEAKSPGDAAKYRKRSRILKARLPRFDSPRYDAAWASAVAQPQAWTLKKLIRADLAFVLDSIQGGSPQRHKAWCAKEVGGDTAAVVDWWIASFAAPKIVFILRNPLMVTRAVLNDRRRKQRRLPIAEIVRETWDPLKVLRAQQALLHRPEIVAVAYERLVADPASAMAKIAAFLQIENGAYLTMPSIFGEPVTVRTASQAKAGIFGSDAQWHDGLPLRERIVVALASAFARLMPGLRVDYAKMVSVLPSAK
jgi:hypothetical protein